MPSNNEWMNRVKAVEREHTAMRFASEYLLNAVQQDPTALKGNLRVRDVNESVERLEGTYTIRLFAEFETSLRTYWLASRITDPPSRTRDLLDGVAARCRIPHDHIQNAHAVREYRNVLVHERDEDVDPIPIALSRRHLCMFLSFLPIEW